MAEQTPPSADGVLKAITETLMYAAKEVVKEFVPGGKYLNEMAEHAYKHMNPKTGLPESPATVIERCFRKLIDLYLDNGFEHVVVAVDNLDRCQPHGVLQFIEAIHLILNVPGVSFVVAVDQDALIRFVNGRYQGTNNEAALYLEKVFPDYYRIPMPWTYVKWGPPFDPMRRYLAALVENAECQKLAKYIKVMWKIISESHALKNPRRIKRLVRRMSLIKSARWSEDSNAFVGFFFLVALSDIWPHVYRAFFYADPDEWQSFVDWVNREEYAWEAEDEDDSDESDSSAEEDVEPDGDNEEGEEEVFTTERKLRELASDEALVEFIGAVCQCFAQKSPWDEGAYRRSLIWNYPKLSELLEHVSKIGL